MLDDFEYCESLLKCSQKVAGERLHSSVYSKMRKADIANKLRLHHKIVIINV